MGGNCGGADGEAEGEGEDAEEVPPATNDLTELPWTLVVTIDADLVGTCSSGINGCSVTTSATEEESEVTLISGRIGVSIVLSPLKLGKQVGVSD